jgi:predicted  nucleic acid-binding Zn-ribbon protein
MGIDMGPEELAQTLRDIQAYDSKIFELEKDIVGLSDKHRLGELADELRLIREAQTATESSLEALEHKQHKLDGELDLLVAKMKKEEEKLFSGTIMNPKELSAIQAEIISLRKKRDEMETEDLEEMEEIDRLGKEVAGAKTRTGLIEENERVAGGAFDEELSDKQAEIAGLKLQRDNLKVLLDEDLIKEYEKLLSTMNGLAVVPIMQGRSCSGCRIDFSRTQIDTFQHNEGIFRCEYCRRILVK